MPRVGGIHRRKFLQVGIALREDAVLDVRVDVGAPVLAEIGGQAAVEPAGHIDEIVGGDVGADGGTVHEPMGIHIHYAGPDHRVEMGTVAVKIEIDFGTVDVGHAALVVELLVIVGEVGLAKILLGIIDDELQFFLRGVVEQLRHLAEVLGHFVIDILGQGLAGGIEIDIVLVGAQVLPVEVLVLDAVFAETDLRTIVELGVQDRGHAEKQQYQQQETQHLAAFYPVPKWIRHRRQQK